MGYTHYWKTSSEFTAEEWKFIQTNARKILRVAQEDWGIALSEEFDINRTPIVDDGQIRFNGYADEGHETFLITRAPTEFSFCKTANKEYDPVTVAILNYARLIAPDTFSWTSDGWLSEHADGLKLLKQACGLDLKWSNVDVDDNDPDRAEVTNVISLDNARDKAS